MKSGIGHIQDVFQIFPLGSNAEIVEHHITLGVLELGPLALGSHGLLDSIEVFVTTRSSACITLFTEKHMLTTILHSRYT